MIDTPSAGPRPAYPNPAARPGLDQGRGVRTQPLRAPHKARPRRRGHLSAGARHRSHRNGRRRPGWRVRSRPASRGVDGRHGPDLRWRVRRVHLRARPWQPSQRLDHSWSVSSAGPGVTRSQPEPHRPAGRELGLCSAGSMPPSADAIPVPASSAPRARAAFASCDSAPKLMSETKIGISSRSGLAALGPITRSVATGSSSSNGGLAS